MDLSHHGYTMGYSDYIFEPWSDGVSGGSSPSQFAGDETLIGPDGAVYDVFYPLKNGQDEKALRHHRFHWAGFGSWDRIW